MSVQHTDVASYSLGLLQDDDRRAFEAHLAECESCTAELAEFAAMASLFSGVDPVESPPPEPAETAIAELIAKRGAAERRRVRQRAMLAVAASLVLLAGGVAWLQNADTPARYLWIAGNVLGLGFSIFWTISAIRRGQLSVDVIAVLALAGAIAVNEPFAGAMITVMLASGQLLEARAAARARRELGLLIERAPRAAHRRGRDGRRLVARVSARARGLPGRRFAAREVLAARRSYRRRLRRPQRLLQLPAGRGVSVAIARRPNRRACGRRSGRDGARTANGRRRL